jgi:hypothetical protein
VCDRKWGSEGIDELDSQKSHPQSPEREPTVHDGGKSASRQNQRSLHNGSRWIDREATTSEGPVIIGYAICRTPQVRRLDAGGRKAEKAG